MSRPVVVDASVAVKWLVNEIHTEEAFALARSWARSDIQPVAPHLMPVEVANALHQRVRRGELSLEAATRLLDALVNSGIRMREPNGLHSRAMQIASQLRQGSTYDAHYLALSDMLDCELWTADERFHGSASERFQNVRLLRTFSE